MNTKIICSKCERDYQKVANDWIESGVNRIEAHHVAKARFPSVLGHFDQQGNLLVKRFLGGKSNYVVISGKEFTVSCGNCGEPVFTRKEGNAGTDSNIREFRVHRETFVGTFSGTIQA